MSDVAREIATVLARRQGERRRHLDPTYIDQVLGELGIASSLVNAVPVPLRLARLHFRGSKSAPDPASSESESTAVATADTLDGYPVDALVPATANEAFTFDWSPTLGVNGIASDRNLRGKSSIINILMWTLTGEDDRLQPRVRSMVEHVEADWRVGAETVRVSFDVVGSSLTGTVGIVLSEGGSESVTEIARFDDGTFKSVMSAIFLSRLRLEQIPMWTQQGDQLHSWPAYASALMVRASQLDPIVGNVLTLGVRMLQMMIGTGWASALAEAQHTADRLAAEQSRTVSTPSDSAPHELAVGRASALAAELSALPSTTPDLASIIGATTAVADLSSQMTRLERQLTAREAEAASVRAQLRSARAHDHEQLESALAERFFSQMEPTICPRCTTPVSDERRVAERQEGDCSVCATHLEPTEQIQSDGEGVPDAGEDGADDSEGIATEIDALMQAQFEADAAVSHLRERLNALSEQRERAMEAAEVEASGAAAAQTRYALELELARAQGAVSALAATLTVTPTSTDEELERAAVRLAIASAAVTVLSGRLRQEQDPLLVDISESILDLAVGFGADSITGVALRGGGTMDIQQGTTSLTYSRLTAGEKLRVKIATAIALVRHGYSAGVGRHPGLLIIDSPTAEEIPNDDFASMLDALIAVADEVGMQVIVATRNPDELTARLDADRLLIARDGNYLF